MPATKTPQKPTSPSPDLKIPELEHAKATALGTSHLRILAAPTKVPSTSSSHGIALSRDLDSTVLSCCDIARSSNRFCCQLLRSIFIFPRSAVWPMRLRRAAC